VIVHRRYLVVSAILLTLGATSAAEANPFGLRLGITDDPDSIFLGLVWEAPITRGRSGSFVVEPGLDVGIGDEGNAEYFTISASAHFKYLIPVGGHGSYAYPLFGPMLFYYNISDCDGDACDEIEAGVNIGGGFRFDRYEIDLWLAITDDIPDIAFAFTFRL